MQFFENAWNNITEKVSEHFEKKRQEQEEFETMRRQAEFQQRIVMEQQEREDSFQEAKRLALENAGKETGIRRLRALNRAERLSQNPNSFYSKLSQHTQKNMQRSEENKRRSQMIREQAQMMKTQDMERKRQERLARTYRRN